MTRNDHLLVLQLLRDVSGSGTGDLDPGLGEEGAGGEHEDDVDGGVNRVGDDFSEGARGGHVVNEAGTSEELGGILERLWETVRERKEKEMEKKARRTSQTPNRRTKKFSGKRLKSIWETM
jgi:hypothetical protein